MSEKQHPPSDSYPPPPPYVEPGTGPSGNPYGQQQYPSQPYQQQQQQFPNQNYHQQQQYPVQPGHQYPTQPGYGQIPGQYSAYPQGYQPVPVVGQPQPQVVVINQRQWAGQMRAIPVSMQCHKCQQVITTRLSYETGVLTFLVAGAICFFGGALGCCLIPFCLDACKDVNHMCPQCNTFLGTYKRM